MGGQTYREDVLLHPGDAGDEEDQADAEGDTEGGGVEAAVTGSALVSNSLICPPYSRVRSGCRARHIRENNSKAPRYISRRISIAVSGRRGVTEEGRTHVRVSCFTLLPKRLGW